MKNYNLAIVIEQDEDGYFAYCPQLQGCYAQGETYEEAKANLEDAIKLHVQDRLLTHEPIPRTSSVNLSTVDIAV